MKNILNEYIDKIFDQLVVDTQEFISIESTLDEETAEIMAPFGKGIQKALEYIQKGLEVKDREVNQALLFNEIVVYERSRDFASAKEKMQQYLAQYPADAAAVKENYFLQTR